MASLLLMILASTTKRPPLRMSSASFGQMAQFARIAATLIRSAFARCKARLLVLAFTFARSAGVNSPFVRELSSKARTCRCVFGCKSSI